MKEIVLKHYPEADNDIIDTSINIFYQLRNFGLERAPSTRELLNWLKYMKQYAKEEAIEKIKGLDGVGALVKTQADLERVNRQSLGGAAEKDNSPPYLGGYGNNY